MLDEKATLRIFATHNLATDPPLSYTERNQNTRNPTYQNMTQAHLENLVQARSSRHRPHSLFFSFLSNPLATLGHQRRRRAQPCPDDPQRSTEGNAGTWNPRLWFVGPIFFPSPTNPTTGRQNGRECSANRMDRVR